MKFFIVFVILQMILVNVAYAEEGDYGGIANEPPNGAIINKDLTKYYNVITATGASGTYWLIGGNWLNENEMMTLPPSSRTSENSPYEKDREETEEKEDKEVKDKDDKDKDEEDKDKDKDDKDKDKDDKDKDDDEDDDDVEVPVSNWVLAGFVSTALFLQTGIRRVQ